MSHRELGRPVGPLGLVLAIETDAVNVNGSQWGFKTIAHGGIETLP